MFWAAFVPLLCDAPPHCVSGTLNFITFGTIPLFAFALSCKGRRKASERVYHGRMLLENEPNGENVSKRRIFLFSTVLKCFKRSCCSAAVFSTLEKFISKRGLICVFPWIHIAHPHSSPRKPKQRMDFKMNNKHFHTQHRCRRLKHNGLVCKIYVASSFGGGKKSLQLRQIIIDYYHSVRKGSESEQASERERERENLCMSC